MYSVCVVTSSRADYGILRPLLLRLHNAADIELQLVVTGMHLAPEFGFTTLENEADGLPVYRRLEIQLSGDSPAAMSKTMGMALIGFADYFQQNPPDLLVLLGDRYEILGICCAAVNQKIPVAHLHGGEITEGAVDNSFRHAITKMSNLHFTATEMYRQRVIQMGEAPETVFNVGAMGVENIRQAPEIMLNELAANLKIPLEDKGYALVTFHPVTLENDTGVVQVNSLMAAMDHFPQLKFIITFANSDAGGRGINHAWQEYTKQRNNCFLCPSLGVTRYISLLRHACFMLGNSSSGILEGPALGIPTVNVGSRQKGRIRAESVIDCGTDKESIISAIAAALTKDFQQCASKVVNPYGNGNVSEKILAIIREFLQHGGPPVMKVFHDIGTASDDKTVRAAHSTTSLQSACGEQ